MLEVYVDAEKFMSRLTTDEPIVGEVNLQMSQQWGEYMTFLATPGFPSCSNTDYLAGISNPDFGASISNSNLGAGTYNFELEYYTPNIVTVTQGLDNIDIHYTAYPVTHTPLSENFIPHENDAEDPIGDSFANESDGASEPDEVEYSIPPEDGPSDVDINVMVENICTRWELRGGYKPKIRRWATTMYKGTHTCVLNNMSIMSIHVTLNSPRSVVTRRQNGHGINTHVVKIANRECSCDKWNQFDIPCSHAQKVCGAYNISVASMVKDYYDLMAYNNTYSEHFEPVQSEDYWDDPNFQLVHDPTIRISTRPGRNQTTRIHNEMDWWQTRARQEAQQQGDSSIQENMSNEDCP
ncbi:UNVERIFIED_CONTAM: hypothetical protein Scaly_2925900 [Sesamum calycinum]|uniref:SWIM-type domain-containing protein n=1 Tax=Sesamum calycinum TaxID=2727403 RepID=A0AAW2KW55_9LAMI